jgi:hypothetical protein
MYCNQCGTRVPDGAKFCQACGSVTAAVAAPESLAPELPVGPPMPAAVVEPVRTGKPVAKRCPKCGLPCPAAAARCRCGHEYFAVAGSPPAAPNTVAVTAPSAVASPRTLEDYKKLFTRQNAPGGIIGGFAGLGGALVGIYSGLNLLIPLGGSMAAIWIGQQTIKGPSRHFVQAVGVQAGHMMWFVLGLTVAGLALLNQVLFDVMFVTAGLVWLVKKPGEWPVKALLAWQGLAIAVNLLMLLAARPGSQEHRALVAHLAMRAAAIYFLVTGVREWRKEVGAAPAAPAVAS